MTSIIKFQPLSGAYSEGPLCYLLTIDRFTFLLDCGLDPNIESETSAKQDLDKLRANVSNINAVLLSHPDSLHLGALPYLVGKCGLNCPIYTTVPVYRMGQMFMYDLHQSRQNYEEFDVFSLDDVDAAFEKIIQLKYNQPVQLEGEGRGLTITPLPAGHMIGGSIWRIVKDNEEDIIYAVDYNHKRERHLNGCVLEQLNRPSLLITDAYNARYSQARRKERDEQLMNIILATLRDNGNCLIAVDTAGRVLELAYMLDQLWRDPESGLMAYSLALLNTISYNVIEFAKSQIEWMSQVIMRSFETQRQNPFQFKHLHPCHNLKELQQSFNGKQPRVVLASQPDLESGFARELFIEWCNNPRNSIILTQRSPSNTLAYQIINHPQKHITIGIKQRIPLEGLELEEYLWKQKEKNPILGSVKDADSESESEEERESEEEDERKVTKKQSMFKVSGLMRETKKAFPMFPAPEYKIKWDDYGEIIDPEEYMVSDYAVNYDNANAGESITMKDTSRDENEQTETPTKCVTSNRTLYMNAQIQMLDFEGRSDKDSLKKIISLIKPKRIILVRGSPDATDEFASYCRIALPGTKIFTPQINEVVDATIESLIYQAFIGDSPLHLVQNKKAKDGTELAWFDALIIPRVDIKEEINGDENQLVKKSIKTASNLINYDENAMLPLLDHALVSYGPPHDIIANDLKLSDFKQVLVDHNIAAEFHGGVLHCNNRIAIKKNESGKISLESFLREDFFHIEDLLYSQYCII